MQNAQSINQAYELLATLEQDMQQMYGKIKTIHNLLQVQNVQQQQPQYQQQQAPVQAGAAQGSTKIDVALWDRPVEQGKTPMVTGVVTLNEVSYSLVLFQSRANDKAMVFNGYVVPKDDNSEGQLSDKKVGGAFIFNNPEGLTISLALDESPLLSQYNCKVPLVVNPAKQPGDRQPTLKGMTQVPHTIVKPVDQILAAQGIQLPSMPQPGQPADAGIQDYNNLNNLLQQQQQPMQQEPVPQQYTQQMVPQQQPQYQQPPTQSTLGSLLQ